MTNLANWLVLIAVLLVCCYLSSMGSKLWPARWKRTRVLVLSSILFAWLVLAMLFAIAYCRSSDVEFLKVVRAATQTLFKKCFL